METVTIEVNRYYGKESKPIRTEVTLAEAEEVEQILINLNHAIENNDEQAISQYETILNEKGIFGETHQKFFSYNKYSEAMEKTNLAKYTKYFKNKAGDNISNYMCYFNAIGEGIMLFYFGLTIWNSIISAIQNASNPIIALILLIALLPFMIVILLLTDLIPFRILSPSGVVGVVNGTISSLGLGGFKRTKVGEVGVDVNLSWFTGITINIPPINGKKSFLFVSGIAAEVKESGT